MKYITGVAALNMPCSLKTGGDWHRDSVDWSNPDTADTDTSVFGMWGIENGHANHLRALADLLADGKFALAQGAEVTIDNQSYHEEFFHHVCMLCSSHLWDAVYNFMYKEFGGEWAIWMHTRM